MSYFQLESLEEQQALHLEPEVEVWVDLVVEEQEEEGVGENSVQRVQQGRLMLQQHKELLIKWKSTTVIDLFT